MSVVVSSLNRGEAMFGWFGIVRVADVQSVHWVLGALNRPGGPVPVRRARSLCARMEVAGKVERAQLAASAARSSGRPTSGRIVEAEPRPADDSARVRGGCSVGAVPDGRYARDLDTDRHPHHSLCRSARVGPVGLETNRRLRATQSSLEYYLIRQCSSITAVMLDHGLCPQIVGKMWARIGGSVSASRVSPNTPTSQRCGDGGDSLAFGYQPVGSRRLGFPRSGAGGPAFAG